MRPIKINRIRARKIISFFFTFGHTIITFFIYIHVDTGFYPAHRVDKGKKKPLAKLPLALSSIKETTERNCKWPKYFMLMCSSVYTRRHNYKVEGDLYQISL